MVDVKLKDELINMAQYALKNSQPTEKEKDLLERIVEVLKKEEDNIESN